MNRFVPILFLAASAVFAQRADFATFIAPMSTRSEVPAITDVDAGGTAVLRAHVVRDAQGRIVSGTVDFKVMYRFPSQVSFTGLHIHTGAAGTNGPVVINSGLQGGANATPSAPNGRGVIDRPAQVRPDDTAALDVLRGMFDNPAGYYVNMHTTVYPNGVIRGQLRPAESVLLMGLMSPLNEVPAITNYNASGIGTVIAMRAFDPDGTFAAGYVGFDANYSFPEKVTFTGFHIHAGPAGVNAPVTVNTGIGAGAAAVESDSSGAGRLTYDVPIEATNTPAFDTLNGLFGAPEMFYINLHTTVYPGGIIRSQLTEPGAVRFPVSMLTSEEVPAITGFNALGYGLFDVRMLRDASGQVIAARAIFDVSYRFPGEVEFTGMHIHDGKRATNGPVTIDSGISGTASVVSDGFGNIMRAVHITGGQPLASLNSLLANPENHYLNLHTTVYRSGVVRNQLAVENTRNPLIYAVISSVSDTTLRTVAPGGLMTIFGTDLFKVPADTRGLYALRVPKAINGTTVTVGGMDAPIVVLGYEPAANPAWYIVAQVPFEVQAGSQPVVVRSSNGPGAAVNLTVAAVAPAAYSDPQGAIAVKVDDFSLLSLGNPASAGESIAFLTTGMGQTAPPLATGQFATELGNLAVAPLSVTIGGQNAVVVGTVAAPGSAYLGMYLTAVRVPSGASGSRVPVVIRSGNAVSNTVFIPLK